jgi:hypothetical protein
MPGTAVFIKSRVCDFFQRHCLSNSASDLVVQLTDDKTHVKAREGGVEGGGRAVMKIAYEITMPAPNKTENVDQCLITQWQ